MKACKCANCLSACFYDPGRLVPEDLKRIAAFLQISELELIRKYLVFIPFKSKWGKGYQLAPVKLQHQRAILSAGEIAWPGYSQKPGRCIFLQENGDCQIHPVKPQECRSYMGCTHTFNGRPYDSETVENYFWRKWDGFDWSFCRELLARSDFFG